MHTQHKWLLKNLMDFFEKHPDYMDVFFKIINREYIVYKNKKLSIRMVYWFVTNYAKQYFVVYDIPNENDKDPPKRFNVWMSYKSTEDSYSKEMFDAYCRKERILIPYNKEVSIETTIAQMNFFKWALLNRTIDYIVQHYSEIEKDMAVRLNTAKKRPIIADGKTRKKREELSINACRSIRKEFCRTESNNPFDPLFPERQKVAA
jgi:hypothetical protein